MHIGFFAGSFDPPTLGHLDLILRSRALCDHLIVGIGNHIEKKALFTPKERIEMVREITESQGGIEVIAFEGLVVEAAVKAKATCLIRGVRTASEFDYEQEMATANRKLGRMETCFLFTKPEFSEISSSLVRSLALHGKRLTGFVSDAIEERIFQRLKAT